MAFDRYYYYYYYDSVVVPKDRAGVVSERPLRSGPRVCGACFAADGGLPSLSAAAAAAADNNNNATIK